MRKDQIDARYRQRQEDIAPVEQMRRLPVHMLGAGGIGSIAALLGAKAGFDLTVYDGDIVEPENINAQMFGILDLGRPKVLAVQEFCALLAAAEIQVVNDFAKGGEPVTGVVVEALDSMAGRAAVWQNVILPRVPFLEAVVSVRMGAESGSMFTVHARRG